MPILGINHSVDAAAALVRQGKVVAASAEERFTRRKHDASFPQQAVSWALRANDLALEDCHALAFFWNPMLHMDAQNARMTSRVRHHLEYLYSLPNPLLHGLELGRLPHAHLRLPYERRTVNCYYVSHHLCHAAHAFFESPFEEAAILTVDGYGERSSTLIASGKGNAITPHLEVAFPHSVGSVYAALTQYLGFKPLSGEGKVMGLASYGEPRHLDLMHRLLRPTADGFEVDLSFFSYFTDGRYRFNERLVDALGPPRAPEAPIEERHYHVAASLQTAVEEVLLHLAALAREKTGLANLCMAGGVTLNCVANGRIVDEAGFEHCFFQPACHDAGTSAGAALYVAHVIEGAPHVPSADKTDYLGPCHDAEAIRAALECAGVQYRAPADPVQEAAERLARGRIVARFDGHAEFGPRALGNRSILSAPGPAEVKDTLNHRVKHREPFRPFAPSAALDSAPEYFEMDQPSPFMLRAHRTRAAFAKQLAAVTHVDGTARVQTVSPKHNPGYLELIRAYGAQTGLECVLNTSFNVRGEPIVGSPEDALRCFLTTGIDDLFIGPFALEKP